MRKRCAEVNAKYPNRRVVLIDEVTDPPTTKFGGRTSKKAKQEAEDHLRYTVTGPNKEIINSACKLGAIITNDPLPASEQAQVLIGHGRVLEGVQAVKTEKQMIRQ